MLAKMLGSKGGGLDNSTLIREGNEWHRGRWAVKKWIVRFYIGWRVEGNIFL